jgi:hypothetical protein
VIQVDIVRGDAAQAVRTENELGGLDATAFRTLERQIRDLLATASKPTFV